MNKYLVNVTAVLLCVAALGLLYITFVPLQVLASWSVTIDGPSHHPGETITAHIAYQKLRNVSGTASRDLECGSPSTSRYPIDKIIGNRPKTSSGDVDILLVLPPNVPTPATCHIVTTIQYLVYQFRTVTEVNESNNFNLVKEQ